LNMWENMSWSKSGKDIVKNNPRVRELQQTKNRYQEELEELKERCKARCSALEEEISELTNEAGELTAELRGHASDLSGGSALSSALLANAEEEEEEEPPGLASLQWVEGPCFSFFVIVVVSVNIIVLLVERNMFFRMTNQMKGYLYWLDQAFLIFYIVETLLKLLLWHEKVFIRRPCGIVFVSSLLTCTSVSIFTTSLR